MGIVNVSVLIYVTVEVNVGVSWLVQELRMKRWDVLMYVGMLMLV